MTNLTHFSTAAIIFQARRSSLVLNGATGQIYEYAVVRYGERRHGGCVAARCEKWCQGRRMPACPRVTKEDVQGWLRTGSMMITPLGGELLANANHSSYPVGTLSATLLSREGSGFLWGEFGTPCRVLVTVVLCEAALESETAQRHTGFAGWQAKHSLGRIGGQVW